PSRMMPIIVFGDGSPRGRRCRWAGGPIVGSSQADKAASHDRIVNIAAARMRRDGVNGVGVAELMQEAGLTHGGFYRHFKSRDDLVGAAVECALAQGSK